MHGIEATEQVIEHEPARLALMDRKENEGRPLTRQQLAGKVRLVDRQVASVEAA